MTSAEPQIRTANEQRPTPLFPAFVVFLLCAPLYKAGNRPLPLLLLELAAVAFLFVLLGVRPERLNLPQPLTAALAILLGYPLMQMLPLPESWWRLLPGHAEYIAAIDRFAQSLVQSGAVTPARTLSVIPDATEQGWLALLPPLACLCVVLRLRSEQLTRLLTIMSVFAALEAVLGLLQIGTLGGAVFYRPDDAATGDGRALGTFINPNHFAAFLGTTLPLAVGLLVHGMRDKGRRAARDEAVKLAGVRDANLMVQRMMLFAVAVLLLLCLVMTGSRAGIFSALAALALTTLLLRRRGGRHGPHRLLMPALLGLVAVLAMLVGMAPFLDKLSPGTLADAWEGRLLMTLTTLRAAVEFLPFGSGLSTLDGVFPRFQAGLGGGIDFAHNDYAQSLLELGLAAPVMIGLALWAYATRMRALWRAQVSSEITTIQLAAGVALVPVMLHSAFDFGLHMPGLAMWFATAAGVLFHRGDAAAD